MSKWNVTLILNKEFQIVLCLQSQTLPDLHYPQWKLSWLSHWRFYCWNKRLYDANKMLSWKGNWTKQEFDIYCYYTHLPFVLSYSLSHIRLLQDNNCERNTAINGSITCESLVWARNRMKSAYPVWLVWTTFALANTMDQIYTSVSPSTNAFFISLANNDAIKMEDNGRCL